MPSRTTCDTDSESDSGYNTDELYEKKLQGFSLHQVRI